jgi:hypothetical protein
MKAVYPEIQLQVEAAIRRAEHEDAPAKTQPAKN